MVKNKNGEPSNLYRVNNMRDSGGSTTRTVETCLSDAGTKDSVGECIMLLSARFWTATLRSRNERKVIDAPTWGVLRS